MAAGKTKLITVGNGAATPVTALSYTPSITVKEDRSVANWPTTDFKVMMPTSSDDASRVGSGESYTFTKNIGARHASLYTPGEIAGYIQTVSGTTTFSQIEPGT